MSEYLPSASIQILKQRALLLRETRSIFDHAGYFEVDTPLLSQDVVVDAWIEPMVALWRPDPFERDPRQGDLRYLQTSPEFAMKRLLAAGADAIYQLGKVFRNGEVGQRHNPEFTMLEWYRTGDDLDRQMLWTEQYLVSLLEWCGDHLQGELSDHAARWLEQAPFERLTYDAAFERHAGLAALTATMSEIQELARSRNLRPPPSLAGDDRDGWLNWLLAELVEPQLGQSRPVFLVDYPASQAALAQTRRRPDGIEVARRFELYIEGVEFCNGYHELTRPEELRRRNAIQAAVRTSAGLQPLPQDSRLLAAMEAGLPESSGVALGFDRLVQWLLLKPAIADVLPFAFECA